MIVSCVSLKTTQTDAPVSFKKWFRRSIVEMLQVRIRVNPISKDVAYEIEGSESEILSLSDETISRLNHLITKLSASLAEQPTAEAPSELLPSLEGMKDWFELQAGRPHLGAMARRLAVRDLILLTIYVHRLPPLSRQTMSAKEVYQFLIEDGFPVGYASVFARISEMTRDGTLIRIGKEGYRLSRKAEDRIKEILSGGVA